MPYRPPVHRPVLPGVPVADTQPGDQRSDDAAAYRKWYNLKRWKVLRLFVLGRDKTCRRCAADGKPWPPVATVANHIKPHRGDPVLFWDPANIEGVCKQCHDARIQKSEHRGYDSAVGEDGRYLDPRHPSNSRG